MIPLENAGVLSAIPIMDQIPFAVIILAVIAMIALPAAVGFLIGRRTSHIEDKSDQPVSTKVGATLILLAFALTLTFSMAISRYNLRRHLEVDEANAIATTYRRAALLPAPHGREVQNILREYTDIRLAAAADPTQLPTAMATSEQLQAQLWQQAEAIAAKDSTSWTASWFIEPLTQVTELHIRRIAAGLHSRVPLTVWMGLALLTILSMLAVGYQAGLNETWRFFPTAMLVLAFTVIIALIVDLDRPQGGLIRVKQAALADVRTIMQDDAPANAIETGPVKSTGP
jgi:hypothetical protein